MKKKSSKTLKPQELETKNLILRNGVYYLCANVCHVQIRQSLHTADLAEARMLRDAKLSILRVHNDERSLLQYVQRQLEGISKEDAEEAAKRSKGPKLSAAWGMWEKDPARRNCSQTQVAGHRQHWQEFIEWLKQKYPVIQHCREVTRSICHEWAADVWQNSRSINNYNKIISSIRYVFSSVEHYDEQFRQPMELIHKKKETDTVVKEPFTLDELHAIFTCQDAEFVRLCAIGLYTTLRFSDARHLTWEMLSQDLTLLDTKHHKTDADASQVTAPELRDILERVPTEQRHGFVCPVYAARPKSAAVIQMMTTLRALGIRTNRQIVGKNGKLRNACIKGFHSFRHTAITLALRNGAGVAQVKRLAGHASEGMQAHYTHMGVEDAGNAAARIGRFW